MDIEGAELFALQGMTKLLSNEKKPIIILEMTLIMMTQAGYSPKDLLEFLGQFGYRCYEFSKKGLHGPIENVFPASENYCFLTGDHLQMEKTAKILQ